MDAPHSCAYKLLVVPMVLLYRILSWFSIMVQVARWTHRAVNLESGTVGFLVHVADLLSVPRSDPIRWISALRGPSFLQRLLHIGKL